MAYTQAQIIVAGHICLDLFPTFSCIKETGTDRLSPGSLINVGEMIFATGGAVSNTGLALHRLGVPVKLIGKIGEDTFGRVLSEILRIDASGLEHSLIITSEAETSYSVVISPPEIDRIFLHCPGANDVFDADDLLPDKFAGARLLHFGYPPIMRKIYQFEGAELVKIFAAAKQNNLTTSLDMTRPDVGSESGKIDWLKFLTRVLPFTDIFLPSFDEALFMLDRQLFEELTKKNILQNPDFFDIELIRRLAERILLLGASVVCLKLGKHGLYLRTTNDDHRLKISKLFDKAKDEWYDREIYTSCFEVSVIGTTGAGDCTIAGFLAALLNGSNPEQTLTIATAVGASSVESLNATRGVPSLKIIKERIASNWQKLSASFDLEKDSQFIKVGEVWIGSKDFTRKLLC